jgi:dipeptidase E
MSNKRILALSSSRAGQSGYLETAVPLVNDLLDNQSCTVAFIPFAAVDGDYAAYTEKVQAALPAAYQLLTVTQSHAAAIVKEADVIMVGGGNTFKLLHDLYTTHVLDLIRDKVNAGTPYIGWSAGANITGATISTTNDMPIINPGSFAALRLFSFQINPHYQQIQVAGFHGETRDQRLTEFLLLHPAAHVIALPEGTALRLANGRLLVAGQGEAALLSNRDNSLVKTALPAGADLSYLL